MTSAFGVEIGRQIEAALAEAYARGKADAKRELRNLLMETDNALGGAIGPTPERANDSDHDGAESYQRQRAPKGLPKKLIDRVLSGQTGGVSPQDIVDAAATEYEKMIKLSSIRGELRNGQRERRYSERDGLWFKRESV